MARDGCYVGGWGIRQCRLNVLMMLEEGCEARFSTLGGMELALRLSGRRVRVRVPDRDVSYSAPPRRSEHGRS